MKVICLGSGPNMTKINDMDTSGLTIVAANNVWKGTDKWNYLLLAGDYPEKEKIIKERHRPPSKMVYTQRGEKSIREAYLGMDGLPANSNGEVYKKTAIKLGIPFYFTVVYWTLYYLKLTHIAFLGFDMDYTPQKDGATAFYGLGYDMQKRGIPDPFFQMREVYNNDPNFMIPLFDGIEKRRGKTNLYNLSDNPNSTLPWNRIGIDEFRSLR
jgi:hypothetical protein